MSLKQIQKLIWNSKIEEALEKIENLSEKDRLNGLIYKIIILIQKREIDNALFEIEKVLSDNQQLLSPTQEFSARIAQLTVLMKAKRFFEVKTEIDTCEILLEQIDPRKRNEIKEWIGRFYAIKAGLQMTMGEISQAIMSFQNSIVLFDEIKYNEALYYQLNNIGWLYRAQGELNEALDYFQKQLIISQEINNKKFIGWTKFNLAYTYFYKGELDQASKFGDESCSLFQELDYNNGLSHVYTVIGSIHRGKGELNKSLEYYHQVLDFYESDLIAQKTVPHAICIGLRDLGIVYLYKNQIEDSYDYFLKAIDTHKSLCQYKSTIYDYEIVVSYLWLIYLCIETNNVFSIENFFDDIEQIAEKWSFLKKFSFAARGLLLKYKHRATDKIKAQQIFQKILNEKFDYEFEFVIQVNLCELLLDELKLYGEEEVIQEIQLLLTGISNIALNQRSITSLVTLYTLQAKLALIEGDIEYSNRLLTRAKTISKEKGLILLSLKVEKQLEELFDQLDQWNALVVQKSSLEERGEMWNIKKYIQMVHTRFDNLERKFEAKKKFKLIYKDLVKNSSKIQKGEFKVGISQIGISKKGDMITEFYNEIKPGLFKLKEEKVDEVMLKVKKVIKTASSNQVKILIFPELSIDLNYKRIAESLLQLANKHDMYIIPGSYHHQNTNQNICTVISPDGNLWSQEKHIPALIKMGKIYLQEAINVSEYPRKTFICNTEYGRIVIVICRDFLDLDLRVELKNFEPPIDLIFNPAFTPVTADFRAAHFDARRSIYAYCLFVNIAEFGDSLIYSPEKERIFQEIPSKVEKLVIKDVNIFKLRSERKKWEKKRKNERYYIQSTKY